jgi:hypothetical protein
MTRTTRHVSVSFAGLSMTVRCESLRLFPRQVKLILSRVKSRPVTVLVGKSEDEFFIHEELVRASSTFFEDALSKDWEEKQERMVRLPGVDIEAFHIYVKWLYSGRFYAVKEGDKDINKRTGSRMDRELKRWSRCYELGNFLQDVDFKDAMIDVMIERMKEGNSGYRTRIAETLYTNSGPDSAHRIFAVDIVINLWHDEDLIADYLCHKSHPVEYLNDLIVAMATYLRDGIPNEAPAEFFQTDSHCSYHEHTGLHKPCYRTKPGFIF